METIAEEKTTTPAVLFELVGENNATSRALFEPRKAIPESLGYDLASAQARVIPPGKSVRVKTSVRVFFPKRIGGLLIARSSMTGKNLIIYPGALDPCFQGELEIQVLNTGDEEYKLEVGERVAQLVLIKDTDAELEAGRPGLDQMIVSDAIRGKRKFGSSGKGPAEEATGSEGGKGKKARKNRPFTVVIHGIPGAGKSSCIKALSDKGRGTVIDVLEPVDLWSKFPSAIANDGRKFNFLEGYYTGTISPLLFQMIAMMSGVENIYEKVEEVGGGKLVLCERGPFESLQVFGKHLVKRADLSAEEFTALTLLEDELIPVVPEAILEPDLSILLTINPEVAAERLQGTRPFPESNALDQETLRRIQEEEVSWFHHHLYPSNPKRLITISAEGPMDEVVGKLERAIGNAILGYD